MNSIYGLLVTVVCVAIIYGIGRNFYDNLTWVVSSVDGDKYLVQNLPDKLKAADLIAKVKQKLVTLITRLNKSYPKNENVKRLSSKFNPNVIQEVSAHSNLTSYSVNKGEKVILCIRSRDGRNTLVSLNTIMFVALHELAHVMTISIGHTTEFWDFFRYILSHAIHWKLYTPVNFKKKPVPYCGTNITDTPLRLKDMPKYINFDEVDKEEKTNDASIVEIKNNL